MRCFFCFLTLVLIGSSTFAQWSVGDISNSQLANSGILVRRYASDINIVNRNEIIVSENLVITILDKDFLKRFRFRSLVNDSIINKSIESKVYDVTGKRIKHTKVEFFNNGSKGMNTGSSIRLLSQKGLIFPLTIELEYKNVSHKIKGFLQWDPVMNSNTLVQNAGLRLSVGDTSLISFHSNKIPLTSNYVNEDGLFVFIWELIDFQAIKKGSSEELPINDLPNLKISSRL